MSEMGELSVSQDKTRGSRINTWADQQRERERHTHTLSPSGPEAEKETGWG